MVLGLDGYTLVHVAISFIGIGAGFIVLGGFLADARLDGAVHTYFAMAVATDVTGAKRKVQNSSKYGKTTQATETAYPSITDAYLTPSAIYGLINLREREFRPCISFVIY